MRNARFGHHEVGYHHRRKIAWVVAEQTAQRQVAQMLGQSQPPLGAHLVSATEASPIRATFGPYHHGHISQQDKDKLPEVCRTESSARVAIAAEDLGHDLYRQTERNDIHQIGQHHSRHGASQAVGASNANITDGSHGSPPFPVAALYGPPGAKLPDGRGRHVQQQSPPPLAAT